ncbi:MAG: hypothetical protein COB94_005725 [Gammaproteobacteria bacterium]|nr:hypothetical protein [Gammaproteobacteria bacterium]
MFNSMLLGMEQLNRSDKQLMYELFERYYTSVSYQSFEQDLNKKSHVILLKSNESLIIGFSAIEVITFTFEGEKTRAVFSGDTVIHHDFWGDQTLAKEWCMFVGKIKALDKGVRLYWFLIVKGHRTYRYLPIFARKYYPSAREETPDRYQRLIDYLAVNKFHDAYNKDLGVIQFPVPKGQLKEEWADIPGKHVKNADVEFFTEKNPGYRSGDELVCIAELSEKNMRFHARHAFLKGMNAADAEMPVSKFSSDVSLG